LADSTQSPSDDCACYRKAVYNSRRVAAPSGSAFQAAAIAPAFREVGVSFVAELPDRMDWESEVVGRLARLLQVQKAQILELLGDPPDINNIPESVWREHGDQLFRALEKDSLAIYIAAAEHILASQPIGVDWGLVNEHAARWAREHARDLALDISSTNRQNVAEALAGFFEQQQTIGDLRNRLASLFGPVRAELIASTEVTRAAVEGELDLVRELGKEGVELTAFWVTERDEKVCPICKPLDKQPESPEGGFVPEGESGPGIPHPPAHPRCRCWLNHVYVGQREAIGA